MVSPVGRFAPSPTGDLHFGSLLAALASYCDTRVHGGTWQLRIDDIDGPRSIAGSADAIQRSLECFGFEWDGPVIWQSQHLDRYRAALASLVAKRRVFACNCSRRSLPKGSVYPGRCRHNLIAPNDADSATESGQIEDHAQRLLMRGNIHLHDAIQGEQRIDLQHDVGDIIIWRRDGLVSYSLACAVDDADGVTHVVRGADLLESTGAQIGIMQALALSPPAYAHIPVACDANGDKLSKHSHAQAIINSDPLTLLLQAWNFLGQVDIHPATLNEFWVMAVKHWQLSRVPGRRRLQV